MARKYSKVEHLVEIIEERAKAGETYREIGASLGLAVRKAGEQSVHVRRAGLVR